jgi:hypothetical protein
MMMFKPMAATLRKGLYVIAAIGLPALAAAQVPDVIGPIPASLPPGPIIIRNCHRNQPIIFPVVGI